MTLTFCMGRDLEGLMNSSLGQPMAQIFLNSFGTKGTLAMWSFIILAQYMMGSSMVRLFFLSSEPWWTTLADRLADAGCFASDLRLVCLYMSKCLIVD
jgi:hypothetical protein